MSKVYGFSMMACGYQITAHQHRISFDDPPHVRIHKLGSNERGFLTPPEAIDLSNIIRQGARIADGDMEGFTQAALPVEIIDLLRRLRNLRVTLPNGVNSPTVFDELEKAIDEVVKLS